MKKGSARWLNACGKVGDKLRKPLRMLDDIRALKPKTESLTRRSSTTEEQVLAILGKRRERDHYFDRDLFADPAWDILLELYAAELGQRRMSTSNLCVAAAVPATTAMRWIGILEKRGLVKRSADPLHGRRVFVGLSQKAFSSMEAYFEAVSKDSSRSRP